MNDKQSNGPHPEASRADEGKNQQEARTSVDEDVQTRWEWRKWLGLIAYGAGFGFLIGCLIVFVGWMTPAEEEIVREERVEIPASAAPETGPPYQRRYIYRGINPLQQIVTLQFSQGDAEEARETISEMKDQEERDSARESIVRSLIESSQGTESGEEPAVTEPAIRQAKEWAEEMESNREKAAAFVNIARVENKLGHETHFEDTLSRARELAIESQEAPEEEGVGEGEPSSGQTGPVDSEYAGAMEEAETGQEQGWRSALWPIGLSLFGAISLAIIKPFIEGMGKLFANVIAESLRLKSLRENLG